MLFAFIYGPMKPLLLALLIACSSFGPPQKKIGLLFFENCEPQLQSTLRQEIQEFYGGGVTVYSPLPLPKSAYYSPRNRYRADSLLNYLYRIKPSGTHILAFTNKDISSTKGKIQDWGVLGLGDLHRGVSVSSSYRAKGGNREQIHNIILNTALHEIGHTYGLQHCSNERCLMRDAEGHLSKWDKVKPWMCPSCKRKVGI